MVKNADITIYRRTFDKATRIDVWNHEQYESVSFHGHQAAAVGNNGLSTADVYTVRIYTDDDIGVNVGDIVVKGLIDVNITGASELTSKYGCFVVTSVSDNRRGSANMHHWRLEGK